MSLSQEEDPFTAFPDEVRQDVDGLIWLGHLQDTLFYAGHEFVLRTLRGDEELLASIVSKEFIESMGQAKAHVWATLALALVAVDGQEDFCPQINPNRRDFARARFNYVTRWYWPTAVALYEKYTALLERQVESLKAVEDFCNGSPQQPLPFADSLNDRAFSADPPAEDIRDYLTPED